MVAKMPYKSLNHSLALMRKQILQGIPYAIKELPKFETPEQIFNWFKKRTTYKNDPPGVELFMTLPTFADKNYWNKPFTGDCDDFTISVLTVLLANGFYNSGIVLVGRSNKNAVHIYAYTDVKQRRKFLDLTNRIFDYERDYTYRQEIPFILTNNEKQKIKNMTLQLAENPAFNVNNFDPTNHIFVPSKGIYLREDLMDNVPFTEWTQGLSAEGYTNEQIAELSGKRAERKATKSGTKATAKATKKTTKASAKSYKKEKRADRERMTPEQKAKLTGSIIKIGGGVVSKFTGAKIPDDMEAPTEQPSAKTTTPGTDDDKILGMPKMLAYGLGTVAVLGLGYVILKPKNK